MFWVVFPLQNPRPLQHGVLFIFSRVFCREQNSTDLQILSAPSGCNSVFVCDLPDECSRTLESFCRLGTPWQVLHHSEFPLLVDFGSNHGSLNSLRRSVLTHPMFSLSLKPLFEALSAKN